MEWLHKIFTPDLISLFIIILPTLAILVGFAYLAYRSHLRHLRRIEEIKRGIYCIDNKR